MTGGTLDLGTFLGVQIFALALVFCRLGSCFMLFPGIGEESVPARMRLLIAVGISVIVMPTVAPYLPPMPTAVPELATAIAGECLVGIFIGVMIRCLLSALDTAGNMISIQIGLGNAQIFNPELAAQTPLPSTLLTLVGLLLIFMTNSHHAMLRGLVASYEMFRPGHVFMMMDYTQKLSQTVSHSFSIGIAIAAPFIIIATCFHFVLGLIARMLPQLQIYFMAMPVQILGGLFALATTISAMMMYWLSRMPDFVPGFVMQN